jgi:hypothetical protein
MAGQQLIIHMTIRSIRPSIAVAFACLVLAGCNPDYGGRMEVSGKVVLKGAPVKDGIIKFTPVTAGTTQSESGAQIVNGEYKLPAESGLMPGKYKVVLTAGDGRTPANTDEPPGPTGANIISKDMIPPEYNVRTRQEVTVTEKGPNVFDYDIK